MKTVKDFTAAGLSISSQDIIDGITGDKSSSGITIEKATTGFSFGIHDAWVLREFAWRKTNQLLTSFNGRIEWTSNVGTLHSGHTNDIDVSLINEWRPLLDQSTPKVTPEEEKELNRMFGNVNDEKTFAPEVEQPCLIKDDNSPEWKAGFIEYENDQGFLFRYAKNGECDFYFSDDNPQFKTTHEPDLIDGECYEFTINDKTLKGYYRVFDKSFYCDMRYAKSKNCSDIKHLTVK